MSGYVRSSLHRWSVKGCSEKFRKIHKKTPLPENYRLKVYSFIKRDFDTAVSCEFCKIFENTVFIEHFLKTSSVLCCECRPRLIIVVEMEILNTFGFDFKVPLLN